MQDRQRIKLNMYVLIKEFLLKSATITGHWGAFAAFFSKFDETLTEIFTVAALQEEDKTGVTLTKGQIEEALIEKILVISEKCRAFAAVEDDMEFLNLIKFMKGELVRLSDVDLIKTAELLNENVLKKLPKILETPDYELEAVELEELMELRSQFMVIYTKPESDKDALSLLTEKLDLLFKKADSLLVKIDAILLLSRTKYADFYAEYTSKRKIGKVAKRTRALQLWVVDDITGLPLTKAKVSIKKKAGKDIKGIIKTTGTKGGVIVATLDAAEYLYEVTYGGYVTETGSFFVNDGVKTEVRVRMKK